MTSVAQTLRLSLLLLTASSLASSQGLAPTTPSKDYIRFGGRVVAIENPAPVVDFSPASVSLVVPVGTSASQVVTVTTVYDGANRPISATGLLGSAQANYVSGALYAPPGGLSSYQYGNNLARQITYNPRLQTSTYSDTNNNTAVQLIGATLGWGTTANNGNLLSAAYVNLGTGTPSSLSFTQNYGYDALNRLTSAGDSGWSRSFGYDAFGNMWVTANSGVTRQGNTPTSSSAFNANNQIATTPSSYDGAGNQTLVNGDTQVYDAENRQISSTYAGASETYVYDGNGQRVEKSGSSGTTVFVYDAMGALAAEYSTAASTPPCTTCYLSADHLGSTRLVTDGGANVIGRHDYLPFGEEIAANTAGRNAQWGAGNDPVNQKFTGKERDSESGLDYFGARYYGSALGRFTSPDETLIDQDPHDPRSWNLYGYVRNNPLRFTDPDGRECTYDSKTNNFTGDCSSPGDEKVTQAGVPQTTTVGAFGDEGLAALAAVGAKLTDPHEWVDLASHAARTTASVAWPGASAVAECITPGGSCDKSNLVLAAIPLPGSSRLTINIEHIAERHMAEGALTGGRDVFVNLDKAGVTAAIRQAYASATTVSVQGERVLLEGVTKTGMTVQMWLNKTTNVIETAYPVGKQF